MENTPTVARAEMWRYSPRWYLIQPTNTEDTDRLRKG